MRYAEEIKKDLINTDDSMTVIAERHRVSPRTVQNINNGSTHTDKKLNYPLRFTGRMVDSLRKKLSSPDKKAVPNPHILSPQLLDYIGLLSLLGADESCLLVFKDVYYRQLKTIFNRDLSDEEILSIIELRPDRPTQLREVVSAYHNPKVRLINTSYWLKTGFIEKSEEGMIYRLLQ